MIELQALSEQEFLERPVATRVIVHDHARRFAALRLDGGAAIALAWRSDGIEPSILDDGTRVWIGVDERVAVVAHDGAIVLALGLASPLLSLQPTGNAVAIVCETEVIALNRNGSIRAIVAIDEPPAMVEDEGDGLAVVYEDGRRQRLW